MFEKTSTVQLPTIETVESRLVDKLNSLNKTSKTWFDGTKKSIENRKISILDAIGECSKFLLSTYDFQEREYELAKLASYLEEEYSILKNIESDFYEKEQINSISQLPQFSIQVI